MKKLYLARHGETLWNKEGRCQGQKDSPLTNLGREQAQKLGKKLADVKIDIAFTSPSGRAIDTCKFALENRDIEIIEDSRLYEFNFGDWSGKLWEDIKTFDGVNYKNFWTYPVNFVKEDCETFENVLFRTKELIDYLKTLEFDNIFVVAHAVTIKSIMVLWDKRELEDFWNDPHINSTSLTIIDFSDEENPIIEKYADISHLTES